MNFGQLVVQLTADASNFKSNLGAAGDSLNKFMGIAKSVVSVTAVFKTASESLKQVFEFREQIDNLSDLGDKFGYSATQIFAIQNAANDAGVSLEDVIKGSDKLATAMNKVGDSQSSAAKAFKALGVSATDAKGNLRDQTEVMDEIISKTNLESLSTKQLAALRETLGKSFRDVIVARKAELVGIEEANKAYADGIGISKEAQTAADDYEKASRGLKLSMIDVGDKIVLKIVPAFTELMKWFDESYRSGGRVKTVLDSISWFADKAGWALKHLAQFVLETTYAFERVGDDIGLFFAETISYAESAVKAADQLQRFNLQGAKEAWSQGQKEREVMEKAHQEKVLEINKTYSSAVDAIWKDRESKTRTLVEPEHTDKNKGTPDKPDASVELTEAEKYLATLQKQLAKEAEMTDVVAAGLFLETEKGKAASDLLKQEIMIAASKVDEAKLNKELLKDYEAIQLLADEYSNSVNDVLAAQGLTAEELKKQQALRKIDLKVEKEIADLRRQNRLTPEAEEGVRSKGEAAKQDVTDSFGKSEENRGSVFDGIKAGWAGINAELTNYNKLAQDFTVDTFNRMSDALTEYVMKGKADFKSLATSVIQSLTQMIIKQQMFNLVKGMMSSYSGFSLGSGWASGSTGTSVSGLSTGTSVSGLNAAGYATGTNFVPMDGFAFLHKGEKVIPASQQGPAYSTGETQFVVHNYVGANVQKTETPDGRGGRRIEVTLTEIVANQARTPGSNLNRAINTPTMIRR